MQFEVSDLLFPGFPKFALRELSKEYGIEFFYEFGKDYYWNNKSQLGASVLYLYMAHV